MPPTLNIIFADISHIDQIIKIWGTNRATLGLMPRDAFSDSIVKKWIIISLNSNNEVNAYLQFRFTNRTQTLSIVHLCVEKDARGTGLSEKLIDKLVNEYKRKARGIKLNCRSDYEKAIAFWQRYNFQPKGQIPSRGSDPNVHLVTWWFSFGQRDLFSFSTPEKTKAVLDFNIIAKLRDQEQTFANEEVFQLQNDWLVGEVEYYQTSETLSEIFRDQNNQRKKSSKLFIERFRELNVDKPSINKLELELKEILPGTSDNDRSDRRQLSETILSGIPYFITLDEGLLKQKKAIANKYSLKIVPPSSFVLEIDASINAADYYPDKLSGNNFTINKANADEKDHIVDNFVDHANSEKKSDFSLIVNQVVSNQFGELKTIKDKEQIVAILGTVDNNDRTRVRILRTKQSSLKQTLFMQNLHNLIISCTEKQKKYLVIDDCFLTEIEKEILISYGFFSSDKGYIRAIPAQLCTIENVENELVDLVAEIPRLKELFVDSFDRENLKQSSHYPFSLEKKLWPLKIKNAQIPCYIVPIKPRYAKELFDSNAVKQNLFGVNPSLIWNKENVYYRNEKPSIEQFPARILWYASAEKSSVRQKSIVCSSYLDEVIVGPAKTIYKKLKKFGIYEWERDILPLAGGNADKNIKALRFSDSEPFTNPIQLRRIKNILKNNNESDNNFQCPLKISSDTFMEIYKLGKKLN